MSRKGKGKKGSKGKKDKKKRRCDGPCKKGSRCGACRARKQAKLVKQTPGACAPVAVVCTRTECQTAGVCTCKELLIRTKAQVETRYAPTVEMQKTFKTDAFFDLEFDTSHGTEVKLGQVTTCKKANCFETTTARFLLSANIAGCPRIVKVQPFATNTLDLAIRTNSDQKTTFMSDPSCPSESDCDPGFASGGSAGSGGGGGGGGGGGSWGGGGGGGSWGGGGGGSGGGSWSGGGGDDA